MAAAIGAGLPVAEPTGSLIVDVGGGTTEVAVISLGGIVVSQSIRVGGDELDEAIVNHCKQRLQTGDRQRRRRRRSSSRPARPRRCRRRCEVEIRGRDLVSGLPKTITLGSAEVREALDETGRPHRRRGQGHARPHPAGAGGRHHGPGHHPCRRRRAPARTRAAPPRRVPDAVSTGRVAVDVRGGRLGHLARGVRDDPPRQQDELGNGACFSTARSCKAPNLGLDVYRKQVRRRRAVLALLVIGSFVLLTITYGQGSGGLQRGVSTIFSPLQAVADRALKPARDLVGWFDETFDARGENSRAQGRTGDGAPRGGRRPGGARRRTRSCASCSSSTAARRDPPPATSRSPAG